MQFQIACELPPYQQAWDYLYSILGLQNAGLVVNDEATLVNLSSFNLLKEGVTWGQIMPRLVTIASLVIIAVLSYKKIKGAVLWGIVGGTGIYYVLGFTVSGFYDGFFSSLEFLIHLLLLAIGERIFCKDIYRRF